MQIRADDLNDQLEDVKEETAMRRPPSEQRIAFNAKAVKEAMHVLKTSLGVRLHGRFCQIVSVKDSKHVLAANAVLGSAVNLSST